MSADLLTKPLKKAPPAKPRRSLPVVALLAGVSISSLVGLGAYAAIKGTPLGGEPVAAAKIERMAKRETIREDERKTTATANRDDADGQQQQLASNIREVPAAAQGRQSAQQLENDAGVRVLRSGGMQAPGAVVIRVPDAESAIKLAPAPDKRITERGRHGNLPKVGAGGLRPADVYARPVTPQQRQAPIRVAVVVSGLGVSSNVTNAAIARLGPNVTLAFAPYGQDLDKMAQKARDDGHEILLQAPMEPFDYPDNDPGPHTLLVDQPAETTLDRLHWSLAQVPGFVGIVNFMGGRFTSNDTALAPLMRDLSQRGLLYLDDGSSGRSVAPQAAQSAGVSSARADIILDAVQREKDIDAALARLEAVARQKGSAIGYAAAYPISVDRISRWAKAAEARGITLVPVSALATSGRRS
jgi:uncharacterized protein